jgi:hypothetical protein
MRQRQERHADVAVDPDAAAIALTVTGASS